MDKVAFETRLKEVSGGTITPVTAYINQRATMVFHCSKCGVKFFGKPSHIIGEEHQRHECAMPYGTFLGERCKQVSSLHKKKAKHKRSNIKQTVQLLDQLLKEGLHPKNVARETGLNYKLVLIYKERLKDGS